MAALFVCLTAVLLHVEPAQAKTPVSIELVLAVDTSSSINELEYDLVTKGIADAFRKPEIVDLIGRQDGVAVALFQWSSNVDERYMIPWHLLKDPASIAAFADKIEAAVRDPSRVFTGIGGAIEFGARAISENAFDGRQLKIDVSGDGPNNIGVTPAISRRVAGALGIVINGLPIVTQIAAYNLGVKTDTSTANYDLEAYYREEIILGQGAFVEVADGYDDFARAFLRKLLRELAPVVSQQDTVPRAPAHETLAHRLGSR